MPRTSHTAHKDWLCGKCNKAILKGSLYRWDLIHKYKDRPERLIRVHPHCRKW